MSDIAPDLLEEMKQVIKNNAHDNEALENALKRFKLDELRELGKEYCGLRVNTATKKKAIGMIVDFIELYRGLSVRERDLYLMRGRELRLVCKRLKIPQDMFDDFKNRGPVATHIIEVEKEKNYTAPLPRSRDGFMEKYWRMRGFLAEVLGEPVIPTGNDAAQPQEDPEEEAPINITDDIPSKVEQAAVIPSLAMPAESTGVEPIVSTDESVSAVSQNPPTDNVHPTSTIKADNIPSASQPINQAGAVDEQLQQTPEVVNSDSDKSDEIARILGAVERGEAISLEDLQTYSKYQNSLAVPAGETVPNVAPGDEVVPPVGEQFADETETTDDIDVINEPSQINADDSEAYKKLIQHVELVEQVHNVGVSIEDMPEPVPSCEDVEPASNVDQTQDKGTVSVAHIVEKQIETSDDVGEFIPPSTDVKSSANIIDVVDVNNDNTEDDIINVDMGSDAIDIPAFNELVDTINSFDNDIEIELSIQEDLVALNESSSTPIDIDEHGDEREPEPIHTVPTIETAKKLADDIDARLQKAQLNLEKRIDYIKRSFAAEIEEISNTEFRVGDTFDEQIKQAKQTGNTMLDGVRDELGTRILNYHNAATPIPADSVNNVAEEYNDTKNNATTTINIDEPVEIKTTDEAIGIELSQDSGNVAPIAADITAGAVSADFVPVLSDSESPIHARIAFAKARVEAELAKLSQPSTNDNSINIVENSDNIVAEEVPGTNFILEDKTPAEEHVEEQVVSAEEQYMHSVFDFDANKLADELVAESEALGSIPERYDQKIYDEIHDEVEMSNSIPQEVSFWEHLMREDANNVPETTATNKPLYDELTDADIDDDIGAEVYSNDGINTEVITMDDISDAEVNDNDEDDVADFPEDMEAESRGNNDTVTIPTIPLDELQEFGELIIDNDMEIEEAAFVPSVPSSTLQNSSVFDFGNNNISDELVEENTNVIGDYDYHSNDTLNSSIDVTLPVERGSNNITVDQPSKTGSWIAGTRNTGTGVNKPRNKSLHINRQQVEDIPYTMPQPTNPDYDWDNAEHLFPGDNYPNR